MNGPRPAGYFSKIATVWLRLMAVLLVFYAVVSVVYSAVWRPAGQSPWAGVVLYGLGAVLLWLLSVPLGRVVAMGLDDPGAGPPAA